MCRPCSAMPMLALLACVATACAGAKPATVAARAAFDGRTAATLAALDRNSGTPCDALTWAARGGQPATILAITDRGVNPDGCGLGMNDWTPLLHAIHKDQPAAVDALIHAGANVNTAVRRFTPLMMAVGNGNLTIAVTGGAFTDIERPLLGACRLEIVKALVRAGAPPRQLGTTLRWKIARAIAHVNGCDAAWQMAMRDGG